MKVSINILNVGACDKTTLFAQVKEARRRTLEMGEMVQQWSFINMDQNIVIRGDVVEISGQRCALWADCYKSVMLLLLEFCHDGDAKVVSYETSDKRLKWHEMLSDYMDQRSTLTEWVNYSTTGSRATYPVMAIPAHFKGVQEAFWYIMRTNNQRGLAAMLNGPEAKLVNVLAAQARQFNREYAVKTA